MVMSSDDATEVAIQKMIDASRRIIISPLNNPAVNRDQELKISTLLNAPRDLAALQDLIFRKEKQKDQARSVIETDQLCTEIEMLQIVRYLLVSSTAALLQESCNLEDLFRECSHTQKERTWLHI